ncbi:hypothetical protein AWB81_06142 [Caballeronia arationis]|jgi:hypothetical protein|uniref:Uncharacterized protein n=1 Tax=Caballeronia arationis TaxID=1777142 RepID=A0A7Z7I7S5_9BURK|nr:hypothetical protein AWB81_06142 [Caballeronia arationis]SOE64407.1 hypothetical protein SAMN05446927_2728 [Caballeronia arationis]
MDWAVPVSSSKLTGSTSRPFVTPPLDSDSSLEPVSVDEAAVVAGIWIEVCGGGP